jgi:hypothetical protein
MIQTAHSYQFHQTHPTKFNELVECIKNEGCVIFIFPLNIISGSAFGSIQISDFPAIRKNLPRSGACFDKNEMAHVKIHVTGSCVESDT